MGSVAVTGLLVALPETGSAEASEGFRGRWFRLDADPIRAQYPYPVSPLYLQLISPGDEAQRAAMSGATASPIPLPPPSVDAGPHLSYALQWFGFAGIFLVGWAALVIRRGGNNGGTGRLSGGERQNPIPE